MNQQLAKMQQLTAHHYVQERLLNEVVTGAMDGLGDVAVTLLVGA